MSTRTWDGQGSARPLVARSPPGAGSPHEDRSSERVDVERGEAGLLVDGADGEELELDDVAAPAIAAGIRTSLLRRGAAIEALEQPAGPAVLLFDGAGVIEATPAAAFWLDDLARTDLGHGEVPAVVRAVDSSAVHGRTVAKRARTGAESWVVLRGAPLGPGRAVVTIEPAGPPEVTSLISGALGDQLAGAVSKRRSPSRLR